MPFPRLLRQPGLARQRRIDMVRGDPVRLQFTLEAGATLNEALSTPLIEAGLQSATLRFSGAGLHPFRYVIPAPASDDRHVAWFSATHAPEGMSTVELACATFGWAGGQPAVHCHAVWREPNGERHAGHILPMDTRIVAPALVTAYGSRTIRLETRPDPETNFALMEPCGPQTPSGTNVVARIAPNQDILGAIETIVRSHGVRDAVILGTLGSLVGLCLTNGRTVPDHAIEVLVRQGHVRGGLAELEVVAVDMAGNVHEGWLQRGRNPVCITFDLLLEAIAG